MLKHFLTVIRGNLFEAERAYSDRNALTLLGQQIREAAESVKAGRRAVAISMVQNRRELEQLSHLKATIADLEARATVALSGNERSLALEAAEAIARLEVEVETSEKAAMRFAAEIERLRNTVLDAEMRLRALHRGQRLAQSTASAQRLNEALPFNRLSSLADAEETLERLRERQLQIDLTASALRDMSIDTGPATIIERLADAGCGTPLKATADDVIARLEARMNPAI